MDIEADGFGAAGAGDVAEGEVEEGAAEGDPAEGDATAPAAGIWISGPDAKGERVTAQSRTADAAIIRVIAKATGEGESERRGVWWRAS